ncbi:MAG: leucine--tRNA ligase [bacterium]|nr:leucine--tRNA ligase [bacterium]
MGYNFASIEKKWQKTWQTKGIYEPKLKSAKKPFFNLMMFPYPSAEGLHVGNMYAFTGADIYGRYQRMKGYDVFEPIGLDGFGIHSENYAIKIGQHPVRQAKISEKNFYRQLEKIGNGFAWKEKAETYDPAYYQWTQWVFIQFFKNGLAYRAKATVNWCPQCQTVLADEQVISGECERCSTTVIKKELTQWFLRITKYADRLLKNLDNLPNRQAGLDWSEKVKIAQRNWIGKSEGAEITFKLKTDNLKPINELKVFTTRPDTLFGVTFLAVSPELAKQWLDSGWQPAKEIRNYILKSLNRKIEEREEAKEKTGVDSGLKAVNPADHREIPIWIADYVLGGYGTGAIMAVPAHDMRDFEFAKKFNLQIKAVIMAKDQEVLIHDNLELIPNKNDPRYYSIISAISKSLEKYPTLSPGVLINSENFDGMDSEEARWKITDFVKGKRQIKYRLRDWLISRQRYWGPPIPMIYCEDCAAKNKGEQKEMPGWYAVSEKDLPVKLPMVKNFRPTGQNQSPLAAVKSFYETKCPACGGKARRETDVSDTFLDSSWYFLAYLILNGKKAHSLKYSPGKFQWDKKMVAQWLPVASYIGGAEHSVLHLLYTRFLSMVFYDLKFWDFEEPFQRFRAHGLLIRDGAKISKSKGNIINPDDYIKKFGADVFRMYLMFLAPFEQGGDFRDSGIMGIKRFLDRVQIAFKKPLAKENKEIQKLLHQTIKKVTEDIENLRYNTAISSLMILLNEIEKTGLDKKTGEVFLKLLAPLAPHLTEELWHSVLKNKSSIHLAAWPDFDPKLIVSQETVYAVQINGKLRDTFETEKGLDRGAAEKIALARPKVLEFLNGNNPKKIIFVPDKIINLVL